MIGTVLHILHAVTALWWTKSVMATVKLPQTLLLPRFTMKLENILRIIGMLEVQQILFRAKDACFQVIGMYLQNIGMKQHNYNPSTA